MFFDLWQRGVLDILRRGGVSCLPSCVRLYSSILMPEAPHHLFVYGTLRRALDRAAYRKLLAPRTTYVGPATCPGRLYDLGSYPGLVAPRHESERVRGEVHRLHADQRDQTLTLLDRYEGCDQPDPAYERVRCRATLADGSSIPVWMYRYRHDLDAARRIPSGNYLTYLQHESA